MDSVEPIPVEEIIAHLLNAAEPVLSTELGELSNLVPPELKLLQSTWTQIPPERRRLIVTRLVELLEDDVVFNFDAVFKFSLNDPDEEVRAAAIEGLWENEDTLLIDLLISRMERDDSERVQAAAALGLGKFVILVEHGKLRQAYLVRLSQSLLRAANDQNRPVEVRRRALEAVAPFSIPEVKQAIHQAYNSTDPRLRVSAVYAMGKNLDPTWLLTLLDEMNSPDPEMRYEAAGACGELEDENSVDGLIELVEDMDSDVRSAAIQALAKIGNREAMDCLDECLKSEDEAIRELAGQVLKELDTGDDPFAFKL